MWLLNQNKMFSSANNWPWIKKTQHLKDSSSKEVLTCIP